MGKSNLTPMIRQQTLKANKEKPLRKPFCQCGIEQWEITSLNVTNPSIITLNVIQDWIIKTIVSKVTYRSLLEVIGTLGFTFQSEHNLKKKNSILTFKHWVRYLTGRRGSEVCLQNWVKRWVSCKESCCAIDHALFYTVLRPWLHFLSMRLNAT